MGYGIMLKNIIKNLTATQIEQLPLVYEAEINHSMLDDMGHMNVRYYWHIFDDATWAFFAGLGMDRDYYASSGNGSFALQQYIYYAAEVHAGESIAVYSRLLGRSERRLHFMHFMINLTAGRLAATVESLGSHADLTVRRTSPFPPQIASRLDEVLSAHTGLTWEAPLCGVIAP